MKEEVFLETCVDEECRLDPTKVEAYYSYRELRSENPKEIESSTIWIEIMVRTI